MKDHLHVPATGNVECEHGIIGNCGHCLWLDRSPESEFWLAESVREDLGAEKEGVQ